MKKKYLIGIVALILALIATLNISVGIYARKYVTYDIELKPDQKIDNVVINNTKIPLDRYVNESVQIGQREKEDKEVDYLYTNSGGEIQIITSIVDNVHINFDGNLDNVEIYKNGELQSIENTAFISDYSIVSIIADSLNYYSILIFIVSFVVLLGLVILVFRFLDKVRENTIRIIDVVIFVCSVFLIYLSIFYISLSLIREVIVVPIIVVAALSLYYIKDTIKENIENAYIVLATFFGIAMLFLIPPFNVPDEGAHFIKSFETSYINNNDGGYSHLPKSIEDFFYKYVQGSHDGSTKYNGKNYLSDFLQNGEYDIRSENVKSYTNTKFLSVVPYIPSIITIAIGRLINLSPLLLVVIGKFTNLLITITLCYVALKKIPCFKKVLFVIALFPIFLHQAAAINMDWLTNLSSLLIVTCVFYYRQTEKEIGNKDIALMSLIAIILAYCKFGYFPILLMVLLIPNDKFKTKKCAIIFKTLFIIVPSLLSYLQNSSLGISNDSPYYHIEYALSHPFSAMKVYFATAFERMPLDIFRGLFDGFGVSTQWHSSLVMYVLIALYVLLIASSGNGEKQFNWKERTLMLILSFLMICIIYSAMFFGWTYFGAPTIDGLQPRYFIPPVILIYLAITNNAIKLDIKNKNIIYSFSMIAIYLLCFLTISLGFY